MYLVRGWPGNYQVSIRPSSCRGALVAPGMGGTRARAAPKHRESSPRSPPGTRPGTVCRQDLNVPVEVVVCDTKREADGLAMSSRNAYLSPAERSAAPVVFRALQAAAEARQRAAIAGR